MTNKERLLAIAELSAAVGAPDFYNRVAKYDSKNAKEWKQMAMTQMVFAQGESDYNPETRGYSTLMRNTLHRGIIEVFKDQRKLDSLQGHSWNADTLFTWFLMAHMTAFRANGWMDNGVRGKDIASNTRVRDWFNGNIPMILLSFAWSYVHPDPYMSRGALMAGAARSDKPKNQ